MRGFTVFLNKKRLCVAGIGDDGVLNTMVDHVVGNGSNELHLRVGGLIGQTDEHVRWVSKRLKKGDEIRLKIIEVESVDKPKKRYRRDSKEDLKAQKRYVRQMAKKLGWRVMTKSTYRP